MRNTFWISFVIALFVSAIIVANYDEDKFMSAVIQSGLVTEKAEISEMEFQNAFMDFIATYQKSYYNSWEFENRYLIFKDNYQKVEDHNLNADMIGFTLKINQFGDLTQEEFKKKYLTLKAPDNNNICDDANDISPFSHFGKRKDRFQRFKTQESRVRDLPDSIDWTEKGKVQEVKNQGSCGSCWAFSAVGALESAVAINSGDLPDLSEQQLVDCSKNGENQGCNGGLMDDAFEYGEVHPMCTEDKYEYTGRDDQCRDEDDKLCEGGVKIKDYTDVEKCNKQALKEALAQQPVSVGVCAEGLAWQFYFGGIVRWLCGQCLDHGVLAVGYGHGGWEVLGDVDYIKIKNSWGSWWGENGYIRVKFEDETGPGTCGVMAVPSYPTV